MKKFLAFAMVLILATGIITGCNTKPQESSQPQTSEKTVNEIKEEKVKFSWLINKVEVKNELEQLAQKYIEKNPNVEIITEVAGGSVEPYGTRIKAKLGSADMPALFVIEGPQDIQTFDQYVADLSSHPLAQKALPGVLEAATLDGKVRALPMTVEGYGLIYNKEMFKKAGVDADAIKTFAGLQTAVETLDSKKKDLGIDAVFALPAKETWIIGSHMFTAFLNAEFKSPIDAFKAKQVEMKAVDSYKKLIDMEIKYSIWPQGDVKNLVNVAYADQLEKGFALGKVAIINNGNWVSPVLGKVAPELLKDDKVGILPLPVEGFKEDCIAASGSTYITINAKVDKKQQDAASKFLEWIYTSPEGQGIVINTLKFNPPYQGFDSNPVTDPLGKEVIKYMNAGKTMQYMFLGTPPGWKAFTGEKVQEYIQGKPWDQVVQEMKDKWSELRQ